MQAVNAHHEPHTHTAHSTHFKLQDNSEVGHICPHCVTAEMKAAQIVGTDKYAVNLSHYLGGCKKSLRLCPNSFVLDSKLTPGGGMPGGGMPGL